MTPAISTRKPMTWRLAYSDLASGLFHPAARHAGSRRPRVLERDPKGG